MDFAFSDEQQMLRSSARSFLAERFAAGRVVALAESEFPYDLDAYREMASLGWTGLSVPEEHGGSGMGFLEEAVLFEEMGRALCPGPFFATVGLALGALRTDPYLLRRVAAGDVTATVAWAEEGGPARLGECGRVSSKAERSADGWVVSASKHLVPDLGAADVVVIVATAAEGVGLWAVEPPPDARVVASTVDSTRPLGRLTLAEAPATMLVEPPGGPGVLASLRLRAIAALALEAVGAGARVLEMGVEHAGSRRQFDKPIGAYQAVSHQLASTFAEIEFARSLAYWAAWCVDRDDGSAPVAALAAAAAASEAAVQACERVIQVHGGIGFTWEHLLHRYYKRAQWIESFDGYPGSHRAEVAAALLDG